jgi:hypothetical protein
MHAVLIKIVPLIKLHRERNVRELCAYLMMSVFYQMTKIELALMDTALNSWTVLIHPTHRISGAEASFAREMINANQTGVPLESALMAHMAKRLGQKLHL